MHSPAPMPNGYQPMNMNYGPGPGVRPPQGPGDDGMMGSFNGNFNGMPGGPGAPPPNAYGMPPMNMNPHGNMISPHPPPHMMPHNQMMPNNPNARVMSPHQPPNIMSPHHHQMMASQGGPQQQIPPRSPQPNMLPPHLQHQNGQMPMPGGPGRPGQIPPHMMPQHGSGMISPHGAPAGGMPHPPNQMMMPMHGGGQMPSRPPGMTPPPPGGMMGPPPHHQHKPYPNQPPGMFNPHGPQMHPCGACRREVLENEEIIICESGCNFAFHRQCISMSPEAFNFIKSEPFAEWVCDTCVKTKNIGPIKFKS